MNPLELILEILRYIKDGGFWSFLLGGLCWSVYLGLCIAIPSVFIVEYLPYATFGGLLIGSAVDKKLALTNSEE